jgi:hypothetical protein
MGIFHLCCWPNPADGLWRARPPTEIAVGHDWWSDYDLLALWFAAVWAVIFCSSPRVLSRSLISRTLLHCGFNGAKKEMTAYPDKSEPPMLMICTKCQLVHDDGGGWLTKKAYRDATGVDPATCLLTPDYCPTCYEFFIQKLQAA